MVAVLAVFTAVFAVFGHFGIWVQWVAVNTYSCRLSLVLVLASVFAISAFGSYRYIRDTRRQNAEVTHAAAKCPGDATLET